MNNYSEVVALVEAAYTAGEMGNTFNQANHLEKLIRVLVSEYVQVQTEKGADGRTDLDLAPVLFTREQAVQVLQDLYLGPGKSTVGSVMEIERGLGNLDQAQKTRAHA